MQAPDPPPPPAARLILASPEALGVSVSGGAPAQTALDWNSVHARLARLGAVGFHLDRLASGGSRVTFMLPIGTQRVHEIEATADTEAAAVMAALEHAEARAAVRK